MDGPEDAALYRLRQRGPSIDTIRSEKVSLVDLGVEPKMIHEEGHGDLHLFCSNNLIDGGQTTVVHAVAIVPDTKLSSQNLHILKVKQSSFQALYRQTVLLAYVP